VCNSAGGWSLWVANSKLLPSSGRLPHRVFRLSKYERSQSSQPLSNNFVIQAASAPSHPKLSGQPNRFPPIFQILRTFGQYGIDPMILRRRRVFAHRHRSL
jgi:hypothetical protein